jgi:hypothetical protein
MFTAGIMAVYLLCGAARAEVIDWAADPVRSTPPFRFQKGPEIPLQKAPPKGVLKAVSADPTSAELPHRDRSEGGHWELSIVGDRLGAAYTFCGNNACLDHKQFTFPTLTHDAAGRRFLFGTQVLATHDAQGAVKLADDVRLMTSLVAYEANGVDVVSARLEFPAAP